MLLAVLDVAAYVQAGAVAGIPDDYPRDETQIGLAWQVGFRVAPDVSLFGGYRSISLPSLSSYFALDHERIYWNLHEHLLPVGVRWTPVVAGPVLLDAQAFVALGTTSSYNSASRLSDNQMWQFSEGAGVRLGMTVRVRGGRHPISLGAGVEYLVANHGGIDNSGTFAPMGTSNTYGWVDLEAFAEVGFR